ncbi:hypothetical protein NM688_g8925 [Phlebia brevispora]|uniref:Uncharacterized protein n=1 Tax=Phlebia brevispora TaxID=194682 RepID=A0ACC1RLG6_9APHY|nr:hypothetical protein NM688_g8925 [Phlebia brevispora]
MIAGLSKAINQYLAPLLLLTSLLLVLFAYLSPNVMLQGKVSLLAVTPSISLTQPQADGSGIDGPSIFLGALGDCTKPSNNGSLTCTPPSVNPYYDLSFLPSNAPDLLSAPTATTPAFIAVSLAFSVIFFFLFTFTALRSKLGKMGPWFDRPMVQRSTAWIGLFGFMIGFTSFLVIRMWFGKAVEDFNTAILEEGKDSAQLVAAVGNGFIIPPAKDSILPTKYGALVSSSNYGWSDSDVDHSEAPVSDEDEDYVDDPRPVKKKRARQSVRDGKRTAQHTRTKARTKASIASLATDALPNQESVSDRLNKVDSAVLTRIKKALALANHENTGEQEAKAALSINQADVLAAEDETQRMKRAGMSVVSIRSLFDSAVRLESWIATVAEAMTMFFDCKVYSTSFSGGFRLEWTFYGLAEHTVAAAYAFEMAYNLVLEWSQARHAGQGRREKTTYRIGVGDGLYALAKQEKNEEKQRAVEMEKRQLEAARRAEEEENQARLKRLEHPSDAGDPPEGKKNEDHMRSNDSKDGVKAEDTRVKIEVVDDEDMIPERPSSSPDASHVKLRESLSVRHW